MTTYAAFGRAQAARHIGAAAESLHQRSLFIHVRPPPASLSERRSVLRVLERYGKTEMFKKMAGNGAFIAITSSAAMASTLIERSPLQYEFVAETFQAVHPWGSPAPRLAPPIQPIETTPSRPAAGARTGQAQAQDATLTDPPLRRQTDLVAHKAFVLSVFPSQDYHHLTMVRQSPLYGPWPRDDDGYGVDDNGGDGGDTVEGGTGGNATYKDSFVYNALKAVVPTSASSEALCDWRIHNGSGDSGSRNENHNNNNNNNSNNDDDNNNTIVAKDGGGQRRTRGSFLSKLAHINARKARRALANKSPLASMLRGESGGADATGTQSTPRTKPNR